MKQGRKPVPAKLRALHGNPSKVAMRSDVPEGRGDLWAPPGWFNDEQRAEWDYALENAPLGLLTATDRGVLVIWCVASVEHSKAVADVCKSGQLMKTEAGNTIQNPSLGIVNRQAAIMLRAGSEMGFSPASRMALVKPGDDGARPFLTRRSSALDDYLKAKPDKLDS